MRINAFSLIELIVVILLLGVMYSLVLTNFKSKKDVKVMSFKELPSYLQKLDLDIDGVFLIYGNKCNKEKLLSGENQYQDNIDLPFNKSFKTYKMNNFEIIKEFDYDDMVLDKKEQHVCFKLNLRKGKFVDKIILKTASKYLLFVPFFQTIKTFDSLLGAQKAYLQTDLYPKNTDDYYKK